MRTSPRSRCAKPMSIVIPRRFSSSKRSASMPVSAFTSAVLPWSMWPAVPMIMFFMAIAFILLLANVALAQQPDSENPTFHAGVALVKVDVQVVGRGGRVVPGLTKSDFAVFDDGRPQNIAYFGHDNEPPHL